MKLYEHNNHTLHVFPQKNEFGTVTYEYHCEMPDRSMKVVDVDTRLRINLILFKKWIDLGCPDRYDLRQIEPITDTRIEELWGEKHNKPLKM